MYNQNKGRYQWKCVGPYISVAHPLDASFTENVSTVSQNEDQKVA